MSYRLREYHFQLGEQGLTYEISENNRSVLSDTFSL
jgi:hypothetical protein